MQDIIDAICADMRDRPDAWTVKGKHAEADFNGTIVEVVTQCNGVASINGIEIHAPVIDAALSELKLAKRTKRIADLRKALNLTPP